MLYPLSYGSGDGAKCGAKFADTPCVISKEVTSASQIRKEPGLESRQTKGHDLVKYFWQNNSPGGKDFPSVRIHLKSTCPADNRNVAVEQQCHFVGSLTIAVHYRSSGEIIIKIHRPGYFVHCMSFRLLAIPVMAQRRILVGGASMVLPHHLRYIGKVQHVNLFGLVLRARFFHQMPVLSP